jgi:hypothetical protein
MKEEEKKLLLSLLEKANEEGGVLEIYDSDENSYSVDWMTIDKDWLSCENKIIIKIEKI